jgi:hypothetical protein
LGLDVTLTYLSSDLEGMNNNLVKLAFSDQNCMCLNKMEEQAIDKDYFEIVKGKINFQEHCLLQNVGGDCDEMEKLLEMITNRDFHKNFVQELNSEPLIIIPR